MLGQQPTQKLVEALDRYRTKTSQSNIAFWTAKIRSLEQDASLSDRQRLDLLAPYHHMTSWARTGHGSTVTSPSQLLIPRGQQGHIELGLDSDGISTPAPESQREQFLEELKQNINSCSLAPDDEELSLPQEYCQLLTLTDAVSDMDWAQTGTAGLDGVRAGVPSETNTGHRIFRLLPHKRQWADEGWTVEAGWQCGIGDMAGTQLLFAHNRDSDIESQKVRKWRVFAFDQDNFDGIWFDSIVDWMEWRSDWLARLPAGWQDERPSIDELDEESDDVYGPKEDDEG